MENENQATTNLNNVPQGPLVVPQTPNQTPEHSSRKVVLIIAGAVILVVILSTIFFVLTQKESFPKSSTNIPTQNPSPTVSAEMRKALDEAKESAKEYTDQQTKLREDLPWLRKLPLANEKYFVYYDLEKKLFVGRVYTKEGEDPEQLKAQAINQLRGEKEIPVDNFQFEWTTTQ